MDVAQDCYNSTGNHDHDPVSITALPWTFFRIWLCAELQRTIVNVVPLLHCEHYADTAVQL